EDIQPFCFIAVVFIVLFMDKQGQVTTLSIVMVIGCVPGQVLIPDPDAIYNAVLTTCLRPIWTTL
ncbi:hypothetical protein BgiMline_028971, partial [Biomphalaria glabrata]